MILLDTNVVSEPLRPRPEPKVLAWLDSQSAETLFLSTVSLAELLFGVESLPPGKRRRALSAALDQKIASLFGDRVIPFDISAATFYAQIVIGARRLGHLVGVADAQIAAIAASRHFAVATRDEAPFKAAGIQVINPWTAAF